jgi:hypothetical protein
MDAPCASAAALRLTSEIANRMLALPRKTASLIVCTSNATYAASGFYRQIRRTAMHHDRTEEIQLVLVSPESLGQDSKIRMGGNALSPAYHAANQASVSQVLSAS